ncbi:MAG: TetR/AcrR family transcriptional regulator [Spirochaetes bacterium]|nr:TetR/AcrR family transcriptional regulator [Spirochaetota bacterium]
MEKKRPPSPRKRKKAPPSEYHHGNLRAALIAAGLQLLARGRDEGLSLRAVARLAKVSHSAPYRHFADKTELLAGLAEEGYRRFAAAMESAAQAAGDPTSALMATGEAYVRFGLGHPELFHLMFDGRLALDATPGLHTASEGAYAVLVKYVSGLPHAAAMSPEQREAFAVSQWAYAHGLTLLILKRQLAHLPLGQMAPEKILSHLQRTLGPPAPAPSR